MAKLSQTFTSGGSSNTAPTSNSTQKKKLSETFTSNPTPVANKVTSNNVLTPSVPTMQKPTSYFTDNDKAVIAEYESLPKTDLLSRLFSTESRDAYKRKQELNPLYEQAKDNRAKDAMTKYGITDDYLSRIAYDPLTQKTNLIDKAAVTTELKKKGVSKSLINDILDYAGRQNSAKKNERLSKFADEHEALGTLASGVLKVQSDVPGYIGNVIDWAQGDPISTTSGQNANTKTVQNMREAASKDLNGIAKFGYDVGTSIMDMAPIIALGGAGGLTYAGASAGQGSIPELVERGLTPNQIMFSSAANGIAEAALEKLPLGNLEKWAQQPIEKSIKSIAKVIGSQMLSEATEEMGTDVINLITDRLINGDKSQFKQDEKQYGFKTALWNFVKQTVYDGLAGAASGGLLGGANTVRNTAVNGFANNSIPTLEQVTNNESLENVEPITGGKATVIQNPYDGVKPQQTLTERNRVSIPEEDFNNASTNVTVSGIDSELYGKSKKTILTKVYETLFKNGNTAFDVPVDGLTYENKPYNVTVNKNAIAKICSDANLSAEKLAVIDNLSNVIKNAEYINSGKYVNYKNGENRSNTIRYDYFETDAKINGKDYVVTFDVQVVPGHNNYRTHKVINEINLTPSSGETGLLPAAQEGTGLSDLNINQNDNSVKNSGETVKEYERNKVSDKALNKILNDHFNMFAKNEEGNALRAELKAAINEYEDTYSEDAYNKILALASQAEQMLKNGTYTFKRDANKRSGKVRTSSYPNYRGTVTENVMGYIDKLQGMNNLINKANEAYRAEISKIGETLSTANADETAWNYLNEIKENFDEYVNTGDETFLENAVNAVNDMTSAAKIKYADVQENFEQGMANAINENKRQSENKVMAEDVGLKKSKAKEIPAVKETSAEMEFEVPLDELEDRRNGATYLSKTAKTLKDSDVYQTLEAQHTIRHDIKDGKLDVERQTHLAAGKEAVKNLEEYGFDGVKERLLEAGTETTQTQIAESIFVIDNEIQKARKSGDTSEISRLTRRLVERMHKVGQALQAMRMYGNTAAGMVTATETLANANVKAYLNDAEKNKNGKNAKSLKQNSKLAEALKRVGYDGTMEKAPVEKTYQDILREVKNTFNRESSSFVDNVITYTDMEYLARMIYNGATTEDIKAALDRHLATGYFGMSAEDLNAITDLYNQADAAKSSKEKAELRKQAASIASKYLGEATFMDKWNAWRYLAMLGNPRTMIRNILGNTTFGAVTDVKDAVGALLEQAFVKEGERTKAILNPKTDADLINAAKKDFDLNAYEEATEGGHKFNMKNEVEGERQIFKSKLLEKARGLTNKVLEESDTFALKQKYAKALAGYLKANGYNASVLKTDNAILEKARAYAIEQAKIATFHADNGFADMLNDWSRSARERGGIGGKIGEVLLESTMPFKKTPANILKQGIEYSPLGMLKLVSEVRSQAGANAYIDTISKGLTGTAILALGAWLTSRGLLVGKRDDKDDLYGKGSDYALQIGDNSYTIDWTAPAAMPLFVGSELYKMMNPNESADEAKNFFEALASVAEPAINMSMLEGLSNTLDAIANAKGDKMSSTIANIGSGYVSQVIPTLAGQVARTIDPYRRSTRTNASAYSNPITATLQKSGEKLMNKIPGLSMLNQQYIDVWGNPQKNSGGNIIGRAVQNFASPGYLNDTSLTDREKKLAELQKTYEGSGSLIPSIAKSNKPDGSRMTNAEYEKFAKARGTELQKAVDAALKYSDNSGVKIEDLQDCVHDIENFASMMAEHKQFGKEISKTYEKAYAAYEVNGYEAVMQYYLMNKNADLDGNGSITQEELAKYLRKSDIPKSQREELFKIKFPKAKEIPSLR